MMHLLIAFLAGCGQSEAPQPQQPAVERGFQLIYQSNIAGEIEPCG
jgi:hypothetical protein